MKKTIGPVVVIDTNPARFTHDNLPSSGQTSTSNNYLIKTNPYENKHGNILNNDNDKGNQATYLLFPIFSAAILILLSTLSSPIIEGLSLANINMGLNIDGTQDSGKIVVGIWGWCISGFNGIENQCSADRGFNMDLTKSFETLPVSLESIKQISEKLKLDYLIANSVMHILACISVWATLTWTLAASGSWKGKEVHAYSWTGLAFNGAGLSSLFVLIAWALDLGMFTRIKSIETYVIDGESISVKPGPAIFMNLFSFLFCLSSYIVRITWGKFKPRPTWTIKGHSDFHNNPLPPNSAALPPNEDLPPTWESLNISDVDMIGEKPLTENSIDQRGFIV